MPFLFLIVIHLLEEAKNVLAGLADESLELGEKGIFKRGVAQAPEAPKAPDAPDAPETVKAPEKKKAPEGVPSIKQVLPAENTKGVRTIVRTPFHTSCRARYSVLHLLGVLSGDNEPPLCKGRWHGLP